MCLVPSFLGEKGSRIAKDALICFRFSRYKFKEYFYNFLIFRMADELEDRSPGTAYEIFLENEQLMERLKLLDFETKFTSKGLRPISRVTFAIQNK